MRRRNDAPTFAFRGEGYPQGRGRFFANRFQRLMFRVSASNEVGARGALLLVIVSMVEDQKRYRAAPAIWNSQLEAFLGCGWDQLDAARKRCVEAGWLHYEAGGKHRAGLYWVTVPACYGDLLEEDGLLGAESGSDARSVNPGNPGLKPDRERIEHRVDHGWTTGTFSPGPNPKSPAPFPEKSGAAAADSEELEQTKDRIRRKLKACGVGLVEETLAQALSNGVAVDAVEATIDYACSRPLAWGPGAIRMRLISRSASLHAPQEGWPPPAPAERARQDSARRLAETSAARAEVATNAVRRDELKQLEFDFGPRLDALPVAEQYALLAALKLDKPFVRRTLGGKPPATLPTIRPQLLRALAAASGSN